MASIATTAPLSDLQISRQIENRLSKDDALENVTLSVQTSVVSLSGTAYTVARPVLGTQEGSDVIHSRFCVGLPDLDQTSEIVRLKHQKAQQVGTCRLPRAQASGQVTEEPRQPGIEAPFDVELVVASETADLAVLRCRGATGLVPPLPLGETPARPGEAVFVLGYPTGI